MRRSPGKPRIVRISPTWECNWKRPPRDAHRRARQSPLGAGKRPECRGLCGGPLTGLQPFHRTYLHAQSARSTCNADRKRRARVGIIGLGYVGLPLARAFAAAGFRVLGFDIDPAKVAEAAARRELHRPHPGRGLIAKMREQRLRGDRPSSSASAKPDAVIICVPTPLTECPRAGPDLHRQLGPGHRRPPAARPAGRPGKHHLSRARRGRWSCRSWRRAACAPGRISSWPSAPSARTPATRLFGARPSPRSSAASSRPAWSWPRRLYGQVVVQVVPRLQPRGGRGVQDPGEHLPGRQHRPGQRAEGALRPHGHRRLGSDRGGQDQAVRLPGVLPRPRPGRPLHPDRPVLPDLGGPQATA